jgi:hypothetical protein
MYHLRQLLYRFGALFCLLIMFTACGPTSQVQSTTPVTPTPTATPNPLNAQTCPAAATARPANMPPLTADSTPGVVYLAQQNNSSALARYYAKSATTKTILQIDSGYPVEASISPDGQWVVLIETVQGQLAIQLVRMDGLYLQTLYCAQPGIIIDAALLSPDQHSLAFNEVQSDENTGTLSLLDLATGQIHTEISLTEPGYPESATLLSNSARPPLLTKSSSHGRTIPVNPLPSQHHQIFVPFKWKDNTSLYITGGLRGSPTPPGQLYLLKDISRNATQQQSNVQLIPITSDANNCSDFDVTPDNQRIVCGQKDLDMGASNPVTLRIQPIAGGPSRVIYSNPVGNSLAPRAISNSTLIFILEQPDKATTLWKINTDGNGLTQLADATSTNTDLQFAYASHLPWSIISPDGAFYAVTVTSLGNAPSALLIGQLNGGKPQTAAIQANALTLVGWSQY